MRSGDRSRPEWGGRGDGGRRHIDDREWSSEMSSRGGGWGDGRGRELSGRGRSRERRDRSRERDEWMERGGGGRSMPRRSMERGDSMVAPRLEERFANLCFINKLKSTREENIFFLGFLQKPNPYRPPKLVTRHF
jgi:hypothetical protein